MIFAVPSRTSFGEGTVLDSGTASGASPETLPSDSQRRPLKFGGASTRFSLPTAVTNVTLEMRSGDERDVFVDDARTCVDDASSNGASSERSFFVANEGFLSESERKPPAAYAMRRLRASVVVERRVPVIGWLVLAAAVVSLSAMGTMVTLERSKPFTQSSWRAQSVLLIAAPWAAAKLKKQGWRGFRAPPTRRRALLVALCWSGWFLTLFYGLATTSIAHAYVLTNTTSAVIVVHTFLTGNAVPRSHVAGVALAMAGAGVVMWQSSFQSSGDAKENEDASSDASSGAATVAGDAVVAAGALSGAAFLVLAKKTREEVELSLLLVLQMLVNLPFAGSRAEPRRVVLRNAPRRQTRRRRVAGAVADRQTARHLRLRDDRRDVRVPRELEVPRADRRRDRHAVRADPRRAHRVGRRGQRLPRLEDVFGDGARGARHGGDRRRRGARARARRGRRRAQERGERRDARFE